MGLTASNPNADDATDRHPSIRGRGKSDEEVRAICSILQGTYGSPRHGNPVGPLDDLIYIILSTRTRDPVFRATFDRLKQRFPDWNGIDQDDVTVVEEILAPGGLSRIKSCHIVAILDCLRCHFGRATLDPLDAMSDAETRRFLTSLPGVSAKVATCVMMYSLQRQVLPVDVHVHRVASRLGFRAKKRPDTSQDLIESAVPPELRYGFHVNAVAHGRSICLPRQPRCDNCPVSSYCDYYNVRKVEM